MSTVDKVIAAVTPPETADLVQELARSKHGKRAMRDREEIGRDLGTATT